jgi:exodeoxyribonuclease VII small subunit
MPDNPPAPKPVETFEASLEELERVVRELEGGDLSLERSIELFERGVTLSDACRKQLEDAETRVEMLIQKDGKTVPVPYQPDRNKST